MKSPAQPSAFALFFGNRGFFPSYLMKEAREELPKVLKDMGHECLVMDASATNHGAVETTEEGQKYAKWLYENKGKFDGVILCLPNFGDETGAVDALKDANVPILIQAYPDDIEKMGPEHRRDSFCGKISIMDVFSQYGIPFTVRKPHTVHPSSEAFKSNVAYFDRICRVTSAMKDMRVGSIGARTTPFKTVRYDEITLQRHGITVETLDMADIFNRMDAVDISNADYAEKMKYLKSLSDWSKVPEKASENLVRLALVMDQVVAEFQLSAFGIRCWTELQRNYGISPCIVTSSLMEQMIPAACEVDVANAITMHALGSASGDATSILDWNNNYREDEDKCILFHCGNVPPSMMLEGGRITDHEILKGTVGVGCGYGCHQGRIKPFPFTFGSMITVDNQVKFYVGEGRFTEDKLPENFFGCAGVAEFKNLQDILLQIGLTGHRHHVSLTPGNYSEPVCEAFSKYLGYDVERFEA